MFKWLKNDVNMLIFIIEYLTKVDQGKVTDVKHLCSLFTK